MKLKAGMVLFVTLLFFVVTIALFARAPVGGSTPTVMPVVVQEMEETAVFPTQQPLTNADAGVQIPCDPNEHQSIREAR